MASQAARAVVDPFAVLALDESATSEQIRTRYLELVRAHPPERDPDRFAEICAAYDAASDPLQRWIKRFCVHELDSRDALMEAFRQRPKRFSTDKLLRCGDRVLASRNRKA
jgi:DnaJ-class molecular chaperone